MPPELLTARLVLRPPAAGDVDAVLRIHQLPAALAYNPSDRLPDRAAAADLLHRWLAGWQRHGVGYWVVADRSEPAPVLGFCGVKPMRLGDAEVLNLFYRLDPDGWGRGVASEAAAAAVGWARRTRPDLPVVARVRPGNAASARVAAKAGLVRAPELDTPGEDGPDELWIRRPDGPP